MIAPLDRLSARLKACFRSEKIEREFDEELSHHIEMLAEENMRSGYAPAEALRRAKQQMGGIEQTRELHREARGIPWLEQLAKDSGFAARQLGRNLGFASVCILTIAVAIAACGTVFSVLDGVLFRPLPYGAADRIVTIWETTEFGENEVSGGVFRDWQQRSENLGSVMLHAPLVQNLRHGGGAARLRGWEVSASFLEVLELTPIAGRGFLPVEEQVNGPPVVMLTEEAWRSRFNADESIVGSSITLDEISRQVVGVLPANAWLQPDVEFFIPAVLNPDQAFRYSRSSHWAYVWGRLKPQASPEQLEAELKSIKASLEEEYPEFKRDWSVAVHPLREMVTREPRPALWTLAAAVALVLLVACANVANLLLARATRRRGELAMRAALGASSRRIFRQSLTKSLLLAGIGGALGLFFSIGSIKLVQAVTVSFLPGAMAPTLDARALSASIAITCGAALLFGILPAWRSCKSSPNETLKNGGKPATAGGRTRSQSLLVIAEVALTIVLLSSAGLLLRSLAKMVSEDPGYNPLNVVTFDLSPPGEIYGGREKRIAYTTSVLEKIQAVPGVSAVGSLSASPLASGVRGDYVSREERPDTRFDYLASVIYVGGGFFEAVETRLVKGRFLSEIDNHTNASRAVVIDVKLAATLFPDDESVGKMVNSLGATWEVVGVIDEMKLDRNPRPHGYMYLPHAYFPFAISIVARAGIDPAHLREPLQKAVASIDAGIPIANYRPLTEALETVREPERFILALVGGFAAVALLLACSGLYGVMSYTTANRQHELCIRRALGATSREIIQLVVKDGARLTLFGMAIGLIAAAGASRLLASQLHQVPTYDPAVIGATLLLFASVSLFACWTPARRAARIDPSAGLRSE